MGYGVWGFARKRNLYAPAELDVLCMVVSAYDGWIGTGANLPMYQPRSIVRAWLIVSDKVLVDQGYKSDRYDGTRLFQ